MIVALACHCKCEAARSGSQGSVSALVHELSSSPPTLQTRQRLKPGVSLMSEAAGLAMAWMNAAVVSEASFWLVGAASR